MITCESYTNVKLEFIIDNLFGGKCDNYIYY